MTRAALGGLALVVAGAERRPGAGENDHLDGAVGVRLVEQAVHLGLERWVSAFMRSGRLSVMVAIFSSTL